MIALLYPLLYLAPEMSEGASRNSGNALVRGCALGGIRTPNLLIRSQMLYPLSYERRSW